MTIIFLPKYDANLANTTATRLANFGKGSDDMMFWQEPLPSIIEDVILLEID